MNGNLSKAEINALRFYIGDVPENIDSKAYVVLNSLFFPDIYTEKARADEGKYLNPDIIADIPRLIRFFELLFSAFRKSALSEDILTYRVERMADYILCRERMQTISMTSTSKNGFLDSYRDRKGIALMKFSLSAGLHCIDIGKVLPHYAKSCEAEILLPPFMKLEITENQPSADELKITDSDGIPPLISCKVKAISIESSHTKPHKLTSDGARAGMHIYTALNSKQEPDYHDIKLYSLWKISLSAILKNML